MKLIRIKITDQKGFRSLQSGFEHHFRKDWQIKEEKELSEFAPFICAGPNGSGKSNLLEALAAIFYHLECMVLDNLPESFIFDEQERPQGFDSEVATPDGFEIEYLIKPMGMSLPGEAHVSVIKEPNKAPVFRWLNRDDFYKDHNPLSRDDIRRLLPENILGYSSGENEILSLPFFKMRFVQYDEYWQALQEQLPYAGAPESRLIYLDNSFSQAILLSNLLYQSVDTLAPFREEIGLETLNEFRIIIRQTVPISIEQLYAFDKNSESERLQVRNEIKTKNKNYDERDLENAYRANILKNNFPVISSNDEEDSYKVHITELLDEATNNNDLISKLKRCSTSWFEDSSTDSLYLDYCVNQGTRNAFQNNFNSALELFQAFQVLLTLNLYKVSDKLKSELYQSDSHYVSETVPTLASDERIMRFKFVEFTKTNINEPVMLKNLSDGEHQLLHTLGLCLLFKDTNSLFLLDEPETHFNPQWRANFISRLRQSFSGSDNQEMLITTHTPFLISDSEPEKVLVFEKKEQKVTVNNPEYNTLGASINQITMATFDKRETIGGLAHSILDKFKVDSQKRDVDKKQLVKDINNKLGDSVEKVLLIKTILDSMEGS